MKHIAFILLFSAVAFGQGGGSKRVTFPTPALADSARVAAAAYDLKAGTYANAYTFSNASNDITAVQVTTGGLSVAGGLDMNDSPITQVTSVGFNAGVSNMVVVGDTLSINFGAIAAGVDSVRTIAVTGAVAGNPCITPGVSSSLEVGLIPWAECTTNDEIRLHLSNNNLVTAVDPAFRKYKVAQLKF